MKPTRSFSTTSSAGILLACVMAMGAAAHPFSCVGCEMTTTYRAALRAYDTARAWGLIARWWIDPEYAPAVRVQQPPAKPDNVCEMRSSSLHAR